LLEVVCIAIAGTRRTVSDLLSAGQSRQSHNSLGDKLWVFYSIGGVADDTGNSTLPSGSLMRRSTAPAFMTA
jgi:hypothetical protein